MNSGEGQAESFVKTDHDKEEPQSYNGKIVVFRDSMSSQNKNTAESSSVRCSGPRIHQGIDRLEVS